MKRTLLLLLTGFTSLLAHAADPIDIGNRRELFVDRFLINQLNGVRLQLHTPRDEGIAFAFDKPWEGPFSGMVTMVRLPDGSLRAYYRGKPVATRDGSEDDVTCVAEPKDVGCSIVSIRFKLSEIDALADASTPAAR